MYVSFPQLPQVMRMFCPRERVQTSSRATVYRGGCRNKNIDIRPAAY